VALLPVLETSAAQASVAVQAWDSWPSRSYLKHSVGVRGVADLRRVGDLSGFVVVVADLVDERAALHEAADARALQPSGVLVVDVPELSGRAGGAESQFRGVELGVFVVCRGIDVVAESAAYAGGVAVVAVGAVDGFGG